MTIRIYLDEDAMDDGFRDALRARGIDVRTAAEEGTKEFTDEQQLLHAKTLGRVLYTFNRRDFMALHTQFVSEGTSHSGIILAPQRRFSVGEQLRRLLLIVEAKQAEEMQDHLLFLSNWG